MDAVSYSLASKQAQRIEKFIENPDSTSGIVTVPKTIASGETITIPAGRVAILPNVVVDGILNIENGGEVFIPSGSTFGDLDQRIDALNNTTINGVSFDGSANITVSDSTAVKLTGNETIAGVKTFSSSPIVPTPTTDFQAANKQYVDTKQANLGFTPVQQGTGIGQLVGNKVMIGWSNENRTKITIDETDMGNIVMDSNIGVANSSLVKTALNASGNAPIYACRAWVNFNGTGTVAIRASGNVSSITDNGTGDYTVNFTTAMPDANYSVTTTVGNLDSTSNSKILVIKSSVPPTALSVGLECHGASNGAFLDDSRCNVIIID